MTYTNIRKAVFLSRPNRFIAHAHLDGADTVCHVKNTGRCRELLVPGAAIYLQPAQNPERKTRWDLIAVEKGERLINMDAAAPNAVFGEWLASGGAGFVPDLLRPECVHGDSRFDFYLEHAGRRIFAEVKGVTLEENGVARFPDAPTERGVKHINGLMAAQEEGYVCSICFVVQMSPVEWMEPNDSTHPAFGDALRRAEEAGVQVIAVDCAVTSDSLSIQNRVPVHLVPALKNREKLR
jgi:sugar fermentation stimulation protein A